MSTLVWAAVVPAVGVPVFVIVRYGPLGVVTLVAGTVAALTRCPERARRATRVLALVHRPTSRGRSVRPQESNE